jgi:hypothetical protein
MSTGAPKWCETCQSWRHSQPCGRDECPVVAAPGAPDIPALIERLRHAAHVSMVSADNEDYYCGVTIKDALAAADALTALSASHEALKAMQLYTLQQLEAAEAQVAALTATLERWRPLVMGHEGGQ